MNPGSVDAVVSLDRFFAVVGAVGTAMSGAIVYLFKIVQDHAKKHSELNREVGELKGKQDVTQQMHAEVLRVVAEAHKEGGD